ncbi:TPA: ead/Ea22-like family protein [Enterobacter asburiae]|nr:ead/Ea22-like family protein [Enterobacter asburiae]
MSNIDKQGLREAAEKALPAMKRLIMMPNDELFDEALLNVDGDVDAANAFNLLTGPETVLALLDELEAKDNRINRLEAIVAVAEQRNALMREWKRALKVPCDLVDNQMPVVIHGMVIRLERLKETEAKLEAAEKRIAELESGNAYIRNRHKELDLLIGKNILVMQAAIIEWQGTGDARKGLAWIYNTLFGPGELPDEAEKDAQAYFDRKYAPLDEELMNLHRWFWEQSEAERAAAGAKGE